VQLAKCAADGAGEAGGGAGEAGGGTGAGFVVVAVPVCFCAGTGAVVVDDELDDVTVLLGVELRALEVAGATGGDEADPPHAASTTGSAMTQRTFTLMLGHYPSTQIGTTCRPGTRRGVSSAAFDGVRARRGLRSQKPARQIRRLAQS